ncbi:DNA-binding CsgD family transcriptional regulator/tetratricopeptide (TPR) repeat protein [Amycolatopsis lexingtonensis]|uniref:DNA-binding CsgD family transcriptional regulator/tetratricopeptide (TPR) repeat protein n=1 Tax=Amycolatopsis lexingtonensis TaxID=218822 RepID=A0ABR9HXC1_9PSEU|nr:AAA family ATPase [Amycolatopsis lexingtonensis]MBE1495560.1 DNA-binding CsgD family transcriptional regulator/tetratricopeptide (TPR) repeat protein [Amycolatopsis lexingtonensis]
MLLRAPELVGRQRELRRLREAWDRTRSGSGELALVLGEAGIGKSRLADELADTAAAGGARVLRGRRGSVGPPVPYRLLTEALLSLARSAADVLTAELDPYLPALGALVPDWWRESHQGYQLSPLTVAEAALRLLTVVGRDTGCVLLLDDLHDADAESLFVLDYLAGSLAGTRVLVVATARHDSPATLRMASAAAQRGRCTVLELSWLGRADVHEMVAGCLGTAVPDVPDEVADCLFRLSAGHPLTVEELLYQMVRDDVLTEVGGHWRVAEVLPVVPAALSAGLARRVEQLDAGARSVLSHAAVLGLRFSLEVACRAADADERTTLAFVRSAIAGQLIEPEAGAAGWYSFRHALTVDALRSLHDPVTLARLAGRAADAVAAVHPGLPGDWCPLAAALRLAAGDEPAAGRLFARAGNAAFARGGADTAVDLLTKADALLLGDPDLDLRGEVLEALVLALGEAGQFDRAASLAPRFVELGTSERAIALHVGLAWAAYLGGRFETAATEVAAARELAGGSPPGAARAAIDAVEANVLVELDGTERIGTAHRLAHRALSHAESHDEPVIACQALLALACVAREESLDEAEAFYERARALTERHRLPAWRAHVLLRLGGHRIVFGGDVHVLELARQEAAQTGAVTVGLMADAILLFYGRVLRGDFDGTDGLLGEDVRTAARFQLVDLVRYLHAIRAVSAAHQGDRRGMEQAIEDFLGSGGDGQAELALVLGLARAFCALLEEDRDRAVRDLTAAAGCLDRFPGAFPLAGPRGVALLLRALDGEVTLREVREQASHADSRLRWNRQFSCFAEAVLLGRQGDGEAAAAAFAEALRASEPFPVARHLGCRLAAEAAIADGWGDPVGPLRAAEAYFHDAGIHAAARACRALLRSAGAPVVQRRTGFEHLPAQLRRARVTTREFDVLRLLSERLGNQEIARRLHISPKTVEKHVSSLKTKTNLDRSELCAYADGFRAR